jgi:hypothetical protein
MYAVRDNKTNKLMAQSSFSEPYTYETKEDAQESADQWQFMQDNDNLDVFDSRFTVERVRG